MCVLCLFVHLAAFIYYCCCYCFRQHYWLIGRVNWIICLKLIAPMLVMYLDFAKFWCFFDQLSIATILFPLEKGACHVHFCLSKHFSIVDEFRIQYEVDSNWTQKNTLNSLLLKPDIPNNTDDEITFGRRHKTLPTSMREKWKVKTRAIWQIAYVLHFFVYVEKKQVFILLKNPYFSKSCYTKSIFSICPLFIAVECWHSFLMNFVVLFR